MRDVGPIFAEFDRLKAEIEMWKKEAFANHPTQWAYDQACAALNKKTEEIESLRAITDEKQTELSIVYEAHDKLKAITELAVKENERLRKFLTDFRERTPYAMYIEMIDGVLMSNV